MKTERVIVISVVLLCCLPNKSYAADDLYPPKVPAAQLEEVKRLKNPIPNTPENVEKGRALFNGKDVCFACHGEDGRLGRGLGPESIKCTPPPVDLRGSGFYKVRTDGELYWVIRYGVPGTCMVSEAAYLSEMDAWRVVLYLKTIVGTK